MTSSYFNNLSIRYKLILVLIIPFLTITYFSVSSINIKVQQQQNDKKSLEFILLSFQIDDLIHDLQKERGISSGFVGSGGKLFRYELLIQRNRTDEKIQTYLNNLLNHGPNKNYWGITDVFSRSKLNLQTLNIIRNKVNSFDNTVFFEGYSELISMGLDIIRNIQLITHGAIISRQSDAYTNLLELQERAGQERGLLNGVFTSGVLDAERFKSIAGYIANQEALLKKFFTLASKNQQDLLRKKMNSQDVYDFERLRTAAIHKATRNDQLNSLQSFIGYGGLIHNFKNYLIRGKQSYADNFNAIYIEAINVIKQYQEFSGISQKEIASLNIIKTTFDHYKKQLTVVNKLKKKGYSLSDIDLNVKMDDYPALEAIEYLHSTVTGLDTSVWWDKASIRIELIRDVSNSVRNDILRIAKENLSTTTDSMVQYFALTIISLAVSFTFAYVFIQYIVGNIINIATQMSEIQEKGEFNNLLHVNGNDEISSVAESFNNLMIEHNKNQEQHADLQHQLLQAQKMEALGQLTGGIAHDFNNMLSSIIGYSDLAMELDNDKVTLHKYLSQVLKSGERAKDLVAQMLAFSRDNSDAELQQVNINALLIESIKMIQPLLPSTIEIVPHISSSTIYVMANPVMINQVIMNLCINARDAINGHGSIDLRLSKVSIQNELCTSCHAPISGDFIELVIQDTGTGLEPEILNNIFDPFFTTKEMGSEKGTGMGLAMVHGIMHQHGGHIIVESELGSGSKFRLLFPLSLNEVKDEVNNVIADSSENISLNNEIEGINILLIDDEESIVTLMKEVLTGHGFEVTGFTDSTAALLHFKENPNQYNLVITDQTMPKLTGAELSAAILKVQPDISIILCSGHSDFIDKDSAENIGVKAYMTKPIKMNDLIMKITQLVGKNNQHL